MKRWVLASVVLGICMPSSAEDLKLPEVDFSRLFTFPQSRAWLDANRDRSAEQIAINSTRKLAKNDVGLSNILIDGGSDGLKQRVGVSGYILSENGRHTVWLDEGFGPQSTVSKFNKPRSKTKKVPVNASSSTRLLKPGQVWLLGENKVEEKFKLQDSNTQDLSKNIENVNIQEEENDDLQDAQLKEKKGRSENSADRNDASKPQATRTEKY